MTTIRFFRSRGGLTGFSCEGHSGYAEAGQDIVCAAVTSAVRLTECILNDVLHADAVVHQGDDARISLKLPKSCPDEAGCQAVLSGFLMYMKELGIENPDYLTVLEV